MIKKHWLSISSKCNNSCIFCLDADNQQNGRFKDDQEVFKEMKAGLRAKAKRLILSGGEATIHPHFIEFIKKAKKLGYKEIQVITNGRMFAYKKFLDNAVVAGLTEITFSIHSHRKKLYEKFSGIKGSYVQAIKGLKNALAYPDLILNIDIVINKLNYQDIYNTILYFSKKFGIYEYDLLQVIPSGRAWENQRVLFYDIKKALPYLKKVFELAKNDKHFHIWTNRFPSKFLEGYEFLIQNPKKLYDDIKGAKEMFESFLCEGREMGCREKERCNYCNLKDFCNTLLHFKKLCVYNKKILKKTVFKIIKPAFCLIKPEINIDKIRINFIKKDKINLLNYSKFYIKNLYKIKSLRCRGCIYNKRCFGININFIVNNNFKVINPIS